MSADAAAVAGPPTFNQAEVALLADVMTKLSGAASSQVATMATAFKQAEPQAASQNSVPQEQLRQCQSPQQPLSFPITTDVQAQPVPSSESQQGSLIYPNYFGSVATPMSPSPVQRSETAQSLPPASTHGAFNASDLDDLLAAEQAIEQELQGLEIYLLGEVMSPGLAGVTSHGHGSAVQGPGLTPDPRLEDRPVPLQTMSLLQQMREQLRQSQANLAAIKQQTAPPSLTHQTSDQADEAQQQSAAAACPISADWVQSGALSGMPPLRPVNADNHASVSTEHLHQAGPAGFTVAHSEQPQHSNPTTPPQMPWPPQNHTKSPPSPDKEPSFSTPYAAAPAQPQSEWLNPHPSQQVPFTSFSNSMAAPQSASTTSHATPSAAPCSAIPQDASMRSATAAITPDLTQLYGRALEWQRRRDQRCEAARKQTESTALDGCTFSPTINRRSRAVLQNKAVSASCSATPQRARASHGDPLRASADAGSQREALDIGITCENDAIPATTAIVHASTAPALDFKAAPHSSSNAASDVGARLYKIAQERRRRQELRLMELMEAERMARQFTAPTAMDVAPRVYNPRRPDALLQHLPTGLEQCTFHPRTNYRPRANPQSAQQGSMADPPSVIAEDSSSGPLLPDDFTFAMYSSSGGPVSRAGKPGSAEQFAEVGDGSPTVAGGVAVGYAVSSSAHECAHSLPHAVGPRQLGGDGNGGSVRGSYVGDGASRQAVTEELDWDEFMQRQDDFLANRHAKVEAARRAVSPGPTMSPGSKRILQHQLASRDGSLHGSMHLARSGAALAAGGEFADCISGGLAGLGLSTAGLHAAGAHMYGSIGAASHHSSVGRLSKSDSKWRAELDLYKECTFRPAITRRAARLPPRSIEQLADGGRQRHEEWLEEQRALAVVKEVEGATFRPQLNTRGPYAERELVQPRVSLRDPEAYLAAVDAKRRARDAERTRTLHEKEVLEMQQCTFKPQTTPLPTYIMRLSQNYSSHFLQPSDQGVEEWEGL